MLDCLEDHGPSQSMAPDVEMVELDGATVVLNSSNCRTFLNYSQNVFLPYIQSNLSISQRVDIVWDEYIQNSLKSHTRNSRGTGVRRRVESKSLVPRNWQSFLRVDENKSELFGYLADQVMTINTAKLVITTKGKDVLSLQNYSTNMLSPCNHEEADSRIFVHIADAVYAGMEKGLSAYYRYRCCGAWQFQWCLLFLWCRSLVMHNFGFGLELVIIKD